MLPHMQVYLRQITRERGDFSVGRLDIQASIRWIYPRKFISQITLYWCWCTAVIQIDTHTLSMPFISSTNDYKAKVAALLFMSLLPLLPHPIFDVSFNFVPALRYSASSHILQMPRGQRVFLIAPCEKKSNHLMCVPDWRLQANPKEKKNHNNENKRNHRRIISNALVHALSNRHRNVALYGEYETTEDWDNKR